MTDGFIRKKVESLTLGEKLLKLRSQYRMSLLEISKATRIQVKYLEALESGDHRELPAEVYVRGFLRSYARYLGLADDAFIKLYDQEKHIRTHLGREEPAPKQKQFELRNAWVFSPRAGILLLVALVLGGTFVYLFREFRSFVAEPQLSIMSPMNGLVTSESSIVVAGKTDRGAQVTLNREPVFVTTEGTFQETLTLQPGPNTFQIVATNRFEKTKEVALFVENTTLVPESVASPQGETAAFQLVIGAVEPLSNLTVESDGVVVWNGPWPKEKEETFSAVLTLQVTTSAAASTQVGGFGQPLQILDPNTKGSLSKTYTRDTVTSLSAPDTP
ncbi:MAG: hypothetical protein E6P95_00685 [Candidatus Moraniibacteriota bacterium]|nr:MAG: hypothetical protein E6P95_00685 [Candidatus Moranbacteria bacterium]